MNLLRKIKVELWVIYLAGLLSLILAISVGILVRQELDGDFKLGVISKAVLFLAEIPSKLHWIIFNPGELQAVEQRFPNVSGFQGKPLEEEVYLLLSRYDGNTKRSIVELVDLKSFEIKKTWNPDINQINKLVDTSRLEFKNLNKDKKAKRYRISHPFLTEDGGLIFHNDSPLIKIDKNSQLVWQNQEDAFHHSTEQDHEGNIWTPSYMYPYQIDKRYVGLEFGNYSDDAITKVSADGEILFRKSVSEILLEHNFELFSGGGGDGFNADPIHLNDIQPVLYDGPHWKRGDVFLSLRNQSMVILYRPSTNKIIWSGVEHIEKQHDVDILDDHRISIFNNDSKVFFDGIQVDGSNKVVIYDFDKDSYSKYLDVSLEKNDVRTTWEGRSEILDSGDLFIEETNHGRLLYFNKDGSKQWQYVNRADDGNVKMVNWSRILYSKEDTKKARNIIKMEN